MLVVRGLAASVMECACLLLLASSKTKLRPEAAESLLLLPVWLTRQTRATLGCLFWSCVVENSGSVRSTLQSWFLWRSSQNLFNSSVFDIVEISISVVFMVELDRSRILVLSNLQLPLAIPEAELSPTFSKRHTTLLAALFPRCSSVRSNPQVIL